MHLILSLLLISGKKPLQNHLNLRSSWKNMSAAASLSWLHSGLSSLAPHELERQQSSADCWERWPISVNAPPNRLLPPPALRNAWQFMLMITPIFRLLSLGKKRIFITRYSSSCGISCSVTTMFRYVSWRLIHRSGQFQECLVLLFQHIMESRKESLNFLVFATHRSLCKKCWTASV